MADNLQKKALERHIKKFQQLRQTGCTRYGKVGLRSAGEIAENTTTVTVRFLFG
jgi:hypothetical protein